eukprot:COSAG01_NODE_160_length_23692_cov_9.703599_30_plen_48_part_00
MRKLMWVMSRTTLPLVNTMSYGPSRHKPWPAEDYGRFLVMFLHGVEM